MKTPRQSHHIKMTRIMGIPDTCGPHEGYQKIMNMKMKWTNNRGSGHKNLSRKKIGGKGESLVRPLLPKILRFSDFF
jgi:hypothetical protein